ncbi:hypothetical protein AB0L06_41375 [Spirillospora sp. NPDC052269]
MLSIPLVLTAATGCGSGEKQSATPTQSAAAEQDKLTKFAQCLRQHGLDVEDPRPGSPGIQIKSGLDDKTKVDTATKACRAYNPVGDIDSPGIAQQDRNLKVAQCLRKKNIRVSDPKDGQGVQIEGKPGEQPRADQAMKECLKEVPDFVPGAGG